MKAAFYIAIKFGHLIVPHVIRSATPELRSRLKVWVSKGRMAAEKTDNPWDNILFDGLWYLLGFDSTDI